MTQTRDHARLGSSGTILVIDDEELVRAVARIVLEQAGFVVLQADDGPAGLECIRKAPPDLRAVVLDLSMPTMGGLEVLAQMRRDGCTVPVLLVSGYSNLERQASCPDSGPTGFLPKPFTPEELLAGVRSVLGRAGV